ncbi:MAG: hypothetical protein JW849_11650 [Phycisphaerae bacterium]|nr:hypothetical protein [Phycisphaerae bacterium]
MKHTIGIFLSLTCLIFAGCDSSQTTKTATATYSARIYDSEISLMEIINNSHWQWDGNHGERIFFNGNGYVEHEGWKRRDLVTRWEIIDRRTVVLEIESGRATDTKAVLTFSDDASFFTGINFHGGTRIMKSYRLDNQDFAQQDNHSVAP